MNSKLQRGAISHCTTFISLCAQFICVAFLGKKKVLWKKRSKNESLSNVNRNSYIGMLTLVKVSVELVRNTLSGVMVDVYSHHFSRIALVIYSYMLHVHIEVIVSAPVIYLILAIQVIF